MAVAAGSLTLITKSNWRSYTMAVSFITALLAYGSLLLPATAAPARRAASFRSPGQRPAQQTRQTLNTSRRGPQLRRRAHEQIIHTRAWPTSDQHITTGAQSGGSAPWR